MQNIGQFSLMNQGGFVAKEQFVYVDSNGEQQHVGGSDDGIDLGQSETSDPGKYGVPNGSMTALYAFVVWGKDNQASQWFTYQSGAPATANYTISGTTLDNKLGLNNVG